MQDKDKIKELKESGKINDKQERMLIDAVEESKKRKERALKERKEAPSGKMKINLKRLIVPAIILLTILLLINFIFIYNGIVKADKYTGEERARIIVLYERKVDLIPNLVEVVKGYAKHEKDTLVAVTSARADAKSALDSLKKDNADLSLVELNQSQKTLTKAVKGLFNLAENYPDIKAHSNFTSLQDQLEGTENRIALAKQRFNASVRNYNTKTGTFPGNIFAQLFGFKEKEFLTIKEATKVKVKFQ